MMKAFFLACLLSCASTQSTAQELLGRWPDNYGLRSAALRGDDLCVGTSHYNTSQPAQVWCHDGLRWDLMRTWSSHTQVQHLHFHEPSETLYVGLLAHHVPGAAQIWALQSDDIWQNVGMAGIPPIYHNVTAIAFLDDELYIGVANEDTGDMARVYRWIGPHWQAVAGDGQNGSWDRMYNGVYDMLGTDDALYVVTTGRDDYDGDVWRFDGVTWMQIGGDGLNGSWDEPHIKSVIAINEHEGDIVTGLLRQPATTPVSLIYLWDGMTWTALPDALEWSTATLANHLVSYRGELYVGVGGPADDGQQASVWRRGEHGWTDLGRPMEARAPPPGKWEWVYRLVPYDDGLAAAIAGYWESTDVAAAQIWLYDSSLLTRQD